MLLILRISWMKYSKLSLHNLIVPSFSMIKHGGDWLKNFIICFFVLELVWLMMNNSFLIFSKQAKTVTVKARTTEYLYKYSRWKPYKPFTLRLKQCKTKITEHVMRYSNESVTTLRLMPKTGRFCNRTITQRIISICNSCASSELFNISWLVVIVLFNAILIKFSFTSNFC